MRSRRPPPSDRRMARMLQGGNPRRKLILLGIVIALLALMGGIGGYGYYSTFVAPTRVLAVRVGDVVHNQGDIVARLKMQQAATIALGEIFDVGREPFEAVRQVTEAEVIRRGAPEYDVWVTEEDIDLVLRQRFYPRNFEDQEFPPGQLEREYRESYNNFLERSHLSHSDYSGFVEEEVYRSYMLDALGENLPTEAEQVEVQWVRLPSLIDPQTVRSPGPDPDHVRERLLSEDFGTVARELSQDLEYSNSSGYVGWVPEGAFPFLDDLLFGTEDEPPLDYFEISDPVHHPTDPEGIFILRVLAGPEVRPISELMQFRLRAEELKRWLGEQISQGSEEGWLEINNDSSLYAWVVKQLRTSAPDATPPASSPGLDIR